MWSYVRDLGIWWVALLSGIASVVLMYGGIIPQIPLQSLCCFLAGYLCLFVAACITIYKLRKPILGGQRREALNQIAKLTEEEKRALQRLLHTGAVTGSQVRVWFPGVDFTRLYRETTFLDWDGTYDRWNIRQDKRELLGSLLSAGPGWTVWAKGWRHLHRLIKALRFGRPNRRI